VPPISWIPLTRPGRRLEIASSRRWVSIALVGVVGLLSGCTSGSSAPADGTVVGTASVCQGLYIPQVQLAAIKVRVSILQQARIVAVQTVQGRHRYRFSVPPGNYVVRSDQGGTTPAKIVVTSGQNTVADLPSICR
jgi:hypothetical protein